MRIRSSTVLMAVALVGLAACGDPTTPVPNPAVLDSVFSDLSGVDALAAPAATMGGMPSTMMGGGGMPSSGTAASCAWTESSKSFVCPTVVTPGGSTIARSFQLLDANAQPLSAFDPAKVAAIRTVVDVTGSRPVGGMMGSGNGTVAYSSHSDQTLSGLLTGARTVNGVATSSSTFTTTDGKSSTFTMKQTIKDLVLPDRTSTSRYPKSGTITMEMTSPDSLGGTRSMTVTMTYNGTSIVTMTFTSGGTTTTCTIDMSQPPMNQSCSPTG